MSNDPLGGMHVRPQPLDRVGQLEQQVRRLQSQIDALRAEPRPQTFYQCRLVHTRSDEEHFGAEYPPAGDTFELVELELDYVESEGVSPATYTPLSAASQSFGRQADDAFVPKNARRIAVRLPNRQQVLVQPGPNTFPVIITSSKIKGFRADYESGDWPDVSVGMAKRVYLAPLNVGHTLGWFPMGDAFEVHAGTWNYPFFEGQLCLCTNEHAIYPMPGHDGFRVIAGTQNPSTAFGNGSQQSWMDDADLALQGPNFTDHGLKCNVAGATFLMGWTAHITVDGSAVTTSAVDSLSCSMTGQQGSAETAISWVVDNSSVVIGPDGHSLTLTHAGFTGPLSAGQVVAPTLGGTWSSGADYAISHVDMWGFQCGQGDLLAYAP